MKEVKTPKKPLAIYYAIVLLVLMLLNFVARAVAEPNGRSRKWTTAPSCP